MTRLLSVRCVRAKLRISGLPGIGISQGSPDSVLEGWGASQFLFVHPCFLSSLPFLASYLQPFRMWGIDARKRRLILTFMCVYFLPWLALGADVNGEENLYVCHILSIKQFRKGYTCVSSLMTPQDASSLLDPQVQLENWEVLQYGWSQSVIGCWSGEKRRDIEKHPRCPAEFSSNPN